MPKRLGVIYAAQSKMLRRFLVNDDGADLSKHVRPGEALIIADGTGITQDNAFSSLTRIADLIQQETGVKPPSSRCAVIKNGAVLYAIQADPGIDTVPGCTLVLHDRADAGWAYVAGQFIEPVRVVKIEPDSEKPPKLGAKL